MTIFKITPISSDACGNTARGTPCFVEAQTLAEVEEYFKGGVFEIMPLNIRTIQQLKDQKVFEEMMR